MALNCNRIYKDVLSSGMTDKVILNILVLHIYQPDHSTDSLLDLELCYPAYAPEHNYIVHNALFPLPDYIRKIKFHGIILATSFLSIRQALVKKPKYFDSFLKKYNFIRDSTAYKIAFPQDEYDYSAITEKWLINWNVDSIYSVLSPKYWKVLYPKLCDSGKLRFGYTAYISEKLIERSKKIRPFSERTIDVSYRSRKNFHSGIMYIKGILGDLFLRYSQGGNGLNLDISANESDRILGPNWLDFVENSKFALCSNSGSSLLDPHGEFRSKIDKYLLCNPNAAYEDIKNNCFPEEEGKWEFTAISPRNIEAALLGTVQICVPGEYGGIMKPWEHYIPLEIDGSNFQQVMDTIENTERSSKIAKACKEKFLSISELRYDFHVKEVVNAIHDGCKSKNETWTPDYEMKISVKKYEKISKIYLKFNILTSRVKRFIRENFPILFSFLRKIIHFRYKK